MTEAWSKIPGTHVAPSQLLGRHVTHDAIVEARTRLETLHDLIEQDLSVAARQNEMLRKSLAEAQATIIELRRGGPWLVTSKIGQQRLWRGRATDYTHPQNAEHFRDRLDAERFASGAVAPLVVHYADVPALLAQDEAEKAARPTSPDGAPHV